MPRHQTADHVRRAYRSQAPRYDRLLEPLAFRLEADRLLLEPDRVFAAAGVPAEVVRRTNRGVFWRLLAVRPTV